MSQQTPTPLGPPAGPPVGPPVHDVWNSPLWANPDTVAGVWASSTTTEPTYEQFYDATPVVKKSRILPVVAGVMAAALIGIGAMQALGRTDDGRSVAADSPSSAPSAPVAPNPSQSLPSQTDPNAQDPNAQDPNAQDPNGLPGIGGLPGVDPNSGSFGSGAQDDPSAAAVDTRQLQSDPVAHEH